MLKDAQKRERPMILGVHLSWAFDNYAQADLEYPPEIQLKMLEGYLDRLEHFLSSIVPMQWPVLLTSLDKEPSLLDTYHHIVRDQVLQLYCKFTKFIDKLSRSWNVHTFVEHNAGDACETSRFTKILSNIDNPKMYVIGGFESGCLSNTVNRLQGRFRLVKVSDLVFDEKFDDDYKRL